MVRECTKLKDEAEASAAKAARLSTDNAKLKQVCSSDGQGQDFCLLAPTPKRSSTKQGLRQELEILRGESAKAATATSLTDAALQRKDAQVPLKPPWYHHK